MEFHNCWFVCDNEAVSNLKKEGGVMACVTCLYTRHSCRGSIDISDVFGSKYRKSEVSNISVKTASFKRGFLEIKQTNKRIHSLDRPAGVRKWIGGEGSFFLFPQN